MSTQKTQKMMEEKAEHKAGAPAHRQDKQWRQRPTRLQRTMTTAAMAMTPVASAAAAIVTDFKVLPKYVGNTLAMLWTIPKTVWFEQNLFEYAVKPFYGMLWGSCPPNDDSYRFLFFPEDEKAPDLKKKYSSLVIVTALHCIFNNTALGRLGIQCMFDDENKIVEQVEVFMKVAIKRYIAKYHGSFITNGFEACVQYICGHGNVKDAKNHDATIEQRITAVEKLFAEATTDKTEVTIDELCNRLAELTGTVDAMKRQTEEMAKTQKQVVQSINGVREEVTGVQRKVEALQTKVEACMEELNQRIDKALEALDDEYDGDGAQPYCATDERGCTCYWY